MKSAVALLCLVALAACGPRYETQHSYTAPESDAGRACVFQCENTRLQCTQLADSTAINQRLVAQQEYSICLQEKQRQAAAGNPYYSCFDRSRTIHASYGSCNANYRQCYQTCGGQVQSTRVCVSGC